MTIGKPETHAYEAILHAAGVTAPESVMIGDRMDTDILVGRRAGAPDGAGPDRCDVRRAGRNRAAGAAS